MTTITGVVTNGVVIPNSPLPEGAQVEIQVKSDEPLAYAPATLQPTPTQLRAMPREKRRAILAAAAALAEEDYLNDKNLTGFDAFAEEDLDDDDTESR